MTLSLEQKKANASARQAVKERERQAMQLRLAGATYPQIQERLGYRSVSGAYDAVVRGLRTLPIPRDPELLRDLEQATLDSYQRALWPLGMGEPATPGRSAVPPNLNAMDRLLALHDRRMRLFGLLREPTVDASAELRRIAAAEGLDPEELLATHQNIVRELEPRGRGRLRAVN